MKDIFRRIFCCPSPRPIWDSTAHDYFSDSSNKVVLSTQGGFNYLCLLVLCSVCKLHLQAQRFGLVEILGLRNKVVDQRHRENVLVIHSSHTAEHLPVSCFGS